MPKTAGAYAVYFDGELVYIGQSNDIANRFCEHRIRHGYAKYIITPWGEVQATTHIDVKVKRSVVIGDWAMWEIRLINRLQPKFNKHHSKRRAA